MAIAINKAGQCSEIKFTIFFIYLHPFRPNTYPKPPQTKNIKNRVTSSTLIIRPHPFRPSLRRSWGSSCHNYWYHFYIRSNNSFSPKGFLSLLLWLPTPRAVPLPHRRRADNIAGRHIRLQYFSRSESITKTLVLLSPARYIQPFLSPFPSTPIGAIIIFFNIFIEIATIQLRTIITILIPHNLYHIGRSYIINPNFHLNLPSFYILLHI